VNMRQGKNHGSHHKNASESIFNLQLSKPATLLPVIVSQLSNQFPIINFQCLFEN